MDDETYFGLATTHLDKNIAFAKKHGFESTFGDWREMTGQHGPATDRQMEHLKAYYARFDIQLDVQEEVPARGIASAHMPGGTWATWTLDHS